MQDTFLLCPEEHANTAGKSCAVCRPLDAIYTRMLGREEWSDYTTRTQRRIQET